MACQCNRCVGTGKCPTCSGTGQVESRVPRSFRGTRIHRFEFPGPQFYGIWRYQSLSVVKWLASLTPQNVDGTQAVVLYEMTKSIVTMERTLAQQEVILSKAQITKTSTSKSSSAPGTPPTSSAALPSNGSSSTGTAPTK
jgi:hypothetical protein